MQTVVSSNSNFVRVEHNYYDVVYTLNVSDGVYWNGSEEIVEKIPLLRRTVKGTKVSLETVGEPEERNVYLFLLVLFLM